MSSNSITKPRPHAEFIHAWAEGATLQFRIPPGESWQDVSVPTFPEHCEYRVKPSYPETRMTRIELGDAALSANSLTLVATDSQLYAIANAAIRHAIGAGQVVIAEVKP